MEVPGRAAIRRIGSPARLQVAQLAAGTFGQGCCQGAKRLLVVGLAVAVPRARIRQHDAAEERAKQRSAARLDLALPATEQAGALLLWGSAPAERLRQERRFRENGSHTKLSHAPPLRLRSLSDTNVRRSPDHRPSRRHNPRSPSVAGAAHPGEELRCFGAVAPPRTQRKTSRTCCSQTGFARISTGHSGVP